MERKRLPAIFSITMHVRPTQDWNVSTNISELDETIEPVPV